MPRPAQPKKAKKKRTPPNPDRTGLRNPGSKKRRKRELAIAGLIECDSQTEAAKRAGIAARTLRAWMQEPDFIEAWRKARRRILESSIGRLQGVTADAVKALHSICLDKDASPSARVRAAAEILGFAMRGAEVTDLAERIEELEARGLEDELGETTMADWLTAALTEGPSAAPTNRLN